MYEKYSVLFVDDEVNILNALKRALIDEEYNCFFSSSGFDALKVMEHEKIAVIVSDMRMPEMDGLHLLREVKEKWPRTVRIVLSGYTQLQQILTTINQVDVFKFITKPWKLEDEFKSIIYQALDFYKLLEENEENKIALEKKNHAYQNILKNIEASISNAKRSSTILGCCGKSIIAYNKNRKNCINENIWDYEERVFDYFTSAVTGEEKEYQYNKIEEEFSQLIRENIKISRIDINMDSDRKVKFVPNILKAALLACIFVFNDEFNRCGLIVNYGMTQKNKFSISLISASAYAAHSANIEAGLQLLDFKVDFINSILMSVMELCNMSFCTTKTNGSLVIVISI